MKRYLTTLLLTVGAFCLTLQAQVDTTRVFYAPKIESNCFAELGSNFIQFNGEGGLNVDFSVNWLISKKYYLGAAYQQLASVELGNRYIDSLDVFEPTAIKLQSLGLRFGYVLFPESKIASFSPDITVGWSGQKWEDERGKDLTHFGFISPALKGVFNVSSFFRIGVSINYRAYIGLDTPSIQGKELNGVGGGVFLRLGTF